MRFLLILTILLVASIPASSIQAASPAVIYIKGEKVASAFAKGAPLIETTTYKVHASRREAGGQSEVHTHETDIFYMLEGSATFVTGGTLVDGKTIAPGEIRGTAIRGGETRRITKGDVIIIPAGTPHWFKDVQGPVLYYVVKPISPSGGSQ